MNSFKNRLTPAQERRLQALDSWHRALEDWPLRMDCPDTYHEELLRQADEMDRQGIVEWEEWRDLRVEADQAYLHAVAGGDYHSTDPSKTTCAPVATENLTSSREIASLIGELRNEMAGRTKNFG